MPFFIRYLGTNLPFSFAITLLLNWAILWYDPNLLIFDNSEGTVSGSHRRASEEVANIAVVVGVLSAIENAEQRRAVRDTWWPASNEPQWGTDFMVHTWFVVGREQCPIPPEDRLEAYACEPWAPIIPDVESDTTLHLSCSTLESDPQTKTKVSADPHTALNFKVHHPVVVSRLGIIHTTHSHQHVVILEDAATQTVVSRTTVGGELQAGVLHRGYVYRAIEPVLLPQGFEGSLVLINSTAQLEDLSVTSPDYDTAGDVIQFRHVTNGQGHTFPFGDHAAVAVSMGYSIHDAESLRWHAAEGQQRREEWRHLAANNAQLLLQEMNQYGDIVQVDVLDVYRNLPNKLLAFYEWVSLKYKNHYVIKTDDDTLLDLRYILTSLQSMNRSSDLWWGRFRQNWGVQRHGKWYEPSYRSITYPPFACGAAYLLSSNLVAWMAKNRGLLHSYQGEDVSMGIWMSALNPTILVHDTRWQCADDCMTDVFSRGQLRPSQLRAAWTALTACQNVCRCDAVRGNSKAYRDSEIINLNFDEFVQ